MAKPPKPAPPAAHRPVPELSAALRELERAFERSDAELAVASRRRQVRWLLGEIDRAIDTPSPRVTAIATEGARWGVAAELAHVIARLGEVGRFLGLFADEADAEAKLGVRL
ncbi:MAG: hypothetical protein HZB39_18570 [Planctomycetes bacterium]|nr:hypothetical protein [Planctomycetota bacterium]